MPKTKTRKIETVILRLLDEEPEVSIRSIAKVLGVSKDNGTERKAINRALLSLVEKNLIIPKNSGRSRVYIKVDQAPETKQSPETRGTVAVSVAEGNSFKGIELSPESRNLLHYVSQGVNERTPVGFNQEFLRSYEPNKTFYLSPEQREKLLEIGRVEAVERPAGTYARNILNRLLIDLSWNSSRLEGNTYSLLETKRLIELGETATGKDASEAQMILNHKAAIEYIVDSAGDEQITSHEIRNLHALLSENLLGDPAASGHVRTIIVSIGGSTYIPLENPQVLQECFDLFVDKINSITDPFEQSLFSIVHLSYLQAFEDVNKRTARLTANIPLIKENLKPLSFTEVEQHAYVSALLGVYERNDISLIRDLYIWAYNRSSQRYTAIQQAMGAPNLLKLRYREIIHDIVRSIITDGAAGAQVVQKIQELIKANDIPEADGRDVFNLIETEIVSLHDGNFARFRVRPSEFQAWKALQ
jgi:Fic family protein